MKKTVKSLIIAASVAAIAGIGAVSFAAWDAGNVTEKPANGSTATINTTAGELKVEGNNLSDTVKLVPYDQVVQFNASTMAKMQTFTVSYDASATGAASVDSYTYKMALTNTSSLPLYYKIGTTTVPEKPETGIPEGWTEWTKDVTLDLASGTQTVNIIMISTDYANHGAGKTYTVTISAETK